MKAWPIDPLGLRNIQSAAFLPSASASAFASSSSPPDLSRKCGPQLSAPDGSQRPPPDLNRKSAWQVRLAARVRQRTSTASFASQRSSPDLNREVRLAVPPQPRVPLGSCPDLPDLNCKCVIAVGAPRPQQQAPDRSGQSGRCGPQLEVADVGTIPRATGRQRRQIAVGTGLQQQAPDRCGHSRTSISTRSQWALPDLNSERHTAVRAPGPNSKRRGHYRTSTARARSDRSGHFRTSTHNAQPDKITTNTQYTLHNKQS